MKKSNLIDALVKIAVIGSEKSGKTSLVNRFYMDSYKENPDATDAYHSKDIKTDGLIVRANTYELEIEKVNQLRGADVILIACDLTSAESVSDLKIMSHLIDRYANTEKPLSIVVVGTKRDSGSDLKIAPSNLRGLSEQLNYSYFETSSKSGESVNEAFQAAIRNSIIQKGFVYPLNTNDHDNIKKMISSQIKEDKLKNPVISRLVTTLKKTTSDRIAQLNDPKIIKAYYNELKQMLRKIQSNPMKAPDSDTKAIGEVMSKLRARESEIFVQHKKFDASTPSKNK